MCPLPFLVFITEKEKVIEIQYYLNIKIFYNKTINIDPRNIIKVVATKNFIVFFFL